MAKTVNRKRKAPPKESFEEEQQRHYAKQSEIWASEGYFWCRDTDSFENRRYRQSSMPFFRALVPQQRERASRDV
jgi:hypothetical protein